MGTSRARHDVPNHCWGPTITNSQHGGRRSRHGKIFTVHANIKQTFRGLGFVYEKIACLNILNTAIWFTLATYTARRRGRKRRADGNLLNSMMIINIYKLPSVGRFLPHRIAANIWCFIVGSSNKLWDNQSSGWWFETPRRPCAHVIVMIYPTISYQYNLRCNERYKSYVSFGTNPLPNC